MERAEEEGRALNVNRRALKSCSKDRRYTDEPYLKGLLPVVVSGRGELLKLLELSGMD